MKDNKTLKLNSVVNGRLGLCAAALTGTAAALNSADATIITFNTPLVVPQTFAGVYINLETAVTGGSAGANPGWDFNPYLSASGLGFYWSPAANGAAQGVSTGVGSNFFADLAPGTVINASSPFTGAIQGTTANFRDTGTSILGFRFTNSSGVVNFGYAVITTTATNGFPATIQSWSFEDSGGAITVIPEPSTTALLTISALVLGALGLRKWRQQSAA